MASMECSLPPAVAIAVTALQNTVVPPGPAPMLVAATLARLPIAPRTPRSLPNGWRRSGLVGALAVAAMLFLLVFTGPWGVFTPTASAFTRVQEQVQQAQSVTCKATFRCFGWHVETKVNMQGDHLRLEDLHREYQGSLMNVRPQNQEPRVSIIDVRLRQVLTLYPQRLRARKSPLEEKVAGDWANPIEQFRRLPTDKAQRLGREQLRGRATEVYEVRSTTLLGIPAVAGQRLLVWVDVQTGLPAKVEVRDGDEAEPLLAFDEMVWNRPLEPRLFQHQLPNGYEWEK